MSHRSAYRRAYSAGSSVLTGRPKSTTWLRPPASGLSRMGFISTVGATPAAAAWTACERPISRPSGVAIGVERHVLGFERRHAIARLSEQSAQPGHEHALAHRRGGALNHHYTAERALSHYAMYTHLP